ncbi:MAG: response regulator [Deltaproteobacteria bacterium]|nr:response regulator [Deltaproteobacteria bacterium]MBW2151273.1 response regulator [Deltaproteobacteria bacterium]
MDIYSKLREKKMLLIDDDEWIRDSLSIFFEAEGCHIHTLETAEEGLEILKHQPYDIIIVDYRLPGMDGLDFLRRIKGQYPNSIKILITAYGDKEIAYEARQLGVNDFIEKPFTTTTIEASLSLLL